MNKIIASAFALVITFTSAQGAFADCGTFLQAGKVYSNRHTNQQGKYFDGRLGINHTYSCAEGTCFAGYIMFPAFNNGASELVTGYWSGNVFKMRRYVDVYSYVQTWSGGCGRGVTGNWVIDPEPFNNGTFSIW
jgi:hypothetical protein